ncbi:MAG: hypothetical protein MZV65_42995 [Chromatiales bacterium]|nr:hypothetical protein [Chromatiales bacterium]
MTAPLLEKARAQAETAHARLREALLAGEDTSAHRRALVEAEQRIAELTRETVINGPDPGDRSRDPGRGRRPGRRDR